MIGAAAAADGVLLQRAPAGRGLARVEHADAIVRRRPRSGGQRCDAAQALQHVERRALARSVARGRGRSPSAIDVLRLHVRAVAPAHFDVHFGIELPERFHCHRPARQRPAQIFASSVPRARRLDRYRRRGRDVAGSDVFGERGANQFGIRRRTSAGSDSFMPPLASTPTVTAGSPTDSVSVAVRTAAFRSRSTSRNAQISSSGPV